MHALLYRHALQGEDPEPDRSHIFWVSGWDASERVYGGELTRCEGWQLHTSAVGNPANVHVPFPVPRFRRCAAPCCATTQLAAQHPDQPLPHPCLQAPGGQRAGPAARHGGGWRAGRAAGGGGHGGCAGALLAGVIAAGAAAAHTCLQLA